MKLLKYEVCGNDFLFLIDLDNRHAISPDFVATVCDRKKAVGADGFIKVTKGPTMKLYNADGSTAELSGNGLCCLAKALRDTSAEAGNQLIIHTEAGARQVTFDAAGSASVDMGNVTLVDEALPDFGRRAQAANIGNPHVVVLVDELETLDLVKIAPIFPNANIEFIVPSKSENQIHMRVWERGVGETKACGSGACTAAFVAQKWGLVGNKVVVAQPGGEVQIELQNGSTTLRCRPRYITTLKIE